MTEKTTTETTTDSAQVVAAPVTTDASQAVSATPVEHTETKTETVKED